MLTRRQAHQSFPVHWLAARPQTGTSFGQMGEDDKKGDEKADEAQGLQEDGEANPEDGNQTRETKPNKIGTFTSWVWQKDENKIILALSDYLREKEGLTPGVLVFDGIMVERPVPYPAMLDEAVLRRSEVFIKNELGLIVRFIENHSPQHQRTVTGIGVREPCRKSRPRKHSSCTCWPGSASCKASRDRMAGS